MSTKRDAEKTKKDSLWQIAGYRRLFASYSISVIGQWFDMIAIMVLFAYIWHAGPFLLALIPIALALPKIVLSQFVGIISRRFHKIKLMGVADLLTVVITIGLFFAPNPWLALALLALRGAVTVVHFPIQQGLIRQLVPETLRLKAITWNGSINQGAKILAPFLGGAFLTVIEPHYLLLINALAFFFSACLLFSLLPIYQAEGFKDERKQESLPFFSEWKQGWTIFFSHRALLMVISLSFLGFTTIQLIDSQFPTLLRELAPTEPQQLTWLLSSIGLGAIVIISALNRLKRLTKLLYWAGTAQLCIATSFIGFSMLSPQFSILLLVGCGFICGVGSGMMITVANYAIQIIPKDDEVTAISGIFETLANLSIVTAPLIGASIINFFGIQATFALCGFLLVLSGILPFIKKEKQTASSFKEQIENT